jgi:hypothetical protein
LKETPRQSKDMNRSPAAARKVVDDAVPLVDDEPVDERKLARTVDEFNYIFRSVAKQPKYDEQRVKASLDRIFELQEQEEAKSLGHNPERRSVEKPVTGSSALPPIQNNKHPGWKQARHPKG